MGEARALEVCMHAYGSVGFLLIAFLLDLALCVHPADAQSRSARAVQQPTPLPTNPAAVAPVTPPTPAISSPLTRTSPLAPLSPQITTTPLSGGIPTRVPSSSPSSTSPSESAPSAPGGGGNTLADCMKMWDRDTHMTKTEWRAACQRSLTRLDTLKIEYGGTAPAKKSKN
jgi:hypothetical protein